MKVLLILVPLVLLALVPTPAASGAAICTPPTGSVRTIAAACVEVADGDACLQAVTLAGDLARCVGLL